MFQHQYKKSSILYELEQAIKKKVAEKPKPREQVQKNIQNSLDKRKSQNQRQSIQRLPSKTKEGIKINKPENMTLFNNENLTHIHSHLTDTKLSEPKKFNNRKMDKLFSLINYALSSADKAMKYINFANFQAQFAVKLFQSDKENLTTQMRGFSLEQIMDSSSWREQQSKVTVPSVIILQQENLKLKKQLALLERQNQRSRGGNNPRDLDLALLLRELQIQKYKQSIYRLKGSEFQEKLSSIIQKQLKYESLLRKGHSTSNQFDSIFRSLISQRNNLCKDFNSAKKYQNDQNLHEQQKINRIKLEKQELMKEIQGCKKKLGEMTEVTILKAEIDALKKQNSKMRSKILVDLPSKVDQSLSLLELVDEFLSFHQTSKQNQNELQVLQTKLQISEKQLQEKQQQIRMMERNNVQLLQQIGKKDHDIKGIKMEIAKKDKMLQENKQELKRLKGVVEQLTDKIRQLEMEIQYKSTKQSQAHENNQESQNLKQKIQQLSHQLESASRRCSKYEVEIKQLKQILQEKTQSYLDSVEVIKQRHHKTLQEKEANHDEVVENLQNQIMGLQKQLQQAMTKFKILSEEMAGLRKMLTIKDSQIETLEKQIDSYISELQKLQVNEGQLKKVSLMEKQIDQHKKQLNKKKIEVEENQRTITKQNDKINQIQESEGKLKKLIKELQQKNMKLESSFTQIQQTEDCLENKNKQIEILHNDVAQKMQLIQTLQQRIQENEQKSEKMIRQREGENENKIKQLESRQKQIQEKQRALFDKQMILQNQKNELIEQLNAVKQREIQIETKQNQLQKREQEILLRKNQLLQMEGLLKQKQEKLDILQQDVHNREAAAEQKLKQIQETRQELDKQAEQIEQQKNAMKLSQAISPDTQKINQDLNQEITQLKNKIMQLESQKVQKHQQLQRMGQKFIKEKNQLSETVEKFRANGQQLREENEKLRSQVEAVKLRNQQQKQQKLGFIRQIEVLSKKIEVQKGITQLKIKDYEETVKKVELELQDFRQLSQKASSELLTLKQNLEKSQRELTDKDNEIVRRQTILLERCGMLEKELIDKAQAEEQANEIRTGFQHEMEEKDSIISKMEQRLSEAQQIKTKMQSLLEAKQVQINNINAKLAAKEHQIKQLQIKIEQIQSEPELQSGKLENLIENVRILQQKLQEYESNQQQKSSYIDSLKKSVGQLTAQIENVRQQKNEVQQKYADVVLKLQLTLVNVEEVLQQKDKIQEELKQMSIQIDELTQLNKNLNQWKTVQMMYQKQYCNLIKRILKATIDLDQIGNVDEMNLRTLLELGSQKVIQHRMRMRDQQSNQKRKRREELQLEQIQKVIQQNGEQGYGLLNQQKQIGQITEFDEKSNVKRKLFTEEQQQRSQLSQQEPDQQQISQKDKPQQQQDKQQGINDLQDFDNLEEGINASLISEDGADSNKEHLIQANGNTEVKQSVVNEPISSNVNESTQKIVNQEDELVQQQGTKKTNDGNETDEIGKKQVIESRNESVVNLEKQIEQRQQPKQKKVQITYDEHPKQVETEQKSEVADKTDGKIIEQDNNLNQIQQKVIDQIKQESELQDFNDFQSEKMNDSMISNEGNLQIVQQRKNENSGAGFDEFKDQNNSELDSSLISESVQDKKPSQQVQDAKKVAVQAEEDKKTEEVHHNRPKQQMSANEIKQSEIKQAAVQSGDGETNQNEFQKFNSIGMDLSQIQINQPYLQTQNNSMEFQNFLDFQNQSNLNSSMISEDKNPIQHKKVDKDHEQGKIEENNSNKQNQNDFDDFNDYTSQKLNDSVISESQIPEHQNKKQIEIDSKQKQEKVQNQLQDFDDYASQKMNSSMFSEKGQNVESGKNQVEQAKKPKEEEKKAQNSGIADFDEFGQCKSDQMNSSLMSEGG